MIFTRATKQRVQLELEALRTPFVTRHVLDSKLEVDGIDKRAKITAEHFKIGSEGIPMYRQRIERLRSRFWMTCNLRWEEIDMANASQPIGFVEELLKDVPELSSVYSEHIEDNDILLPHVFLGDVTRFFVDEVQRDAASDAVGRILTLMENALASGSAEVQELIGVSFVENLAEYGDVLKEIAARLGPKMKEELESFRG